MGSGRPWITRGPAGRFAPGTPGDRSRQIPFWSAAGESDELEAIHTDKLWRDGAALWELPVSLAVEHVQGGFMGAGLSRPARLEPQASPSCLLDCSRSSPAPSSTDFFQYLAGGLIFRPPAFLIPFRYREVNSLPQLSPLIIGSDWHGSSETGKICRVVPTPGQSRLVVSARTRLGRLSWG